MGRNFGRIIIMLCCTILLAATAQAKTLKEVYLKAGGIIECQKVWQSHGKVMVLVNRDTLVDLARDEVDLKKTFGKKPSKTVKKARARKKAVPEAVAVTPQAAPQPLAKPGAVTATVQKAGEVPAAKPAAPTSKPAAPTAKPAAPIAKPTAPIAKPPVQGTATSVGKPATGAAVTSSQPQRPSLPLAKSTPPPPPQKSFLESNMLSIALVALLLLLVTGYLVYKKKQ